MITKEQLEKSVHIVSNGREYTVSCLLCINKRLQCTELALELAQREVKALVWNDLYRALNIRLQQLSHDVQHTLYEAPNLHCDLGTTIRKIQGLFEQVQQLTKNPF